MLGPSFFISCLFLVGNEVIWNKIGEQRWPKEKTEDGKTENRTLMREHMYIMKKVNSSSTFLQ